MEDTSLSAQTPPLLGPPTVLLLAKHDHHVAGVEAELAAARAGEGVDRPGKLGLDLVAWAGLFTAAGVKRRCSQLGLDLVAWAGLVGPGALARLRQVLPPPCRRLPLRRLQDMSRTCRGRVVASACAGASRCVAWLAAW